MKKINRCPLNYMHHKKKIPSKEQLLIKNHKDALRSLSSNLVYVLSIPDLPREHLPAILGIIWRPFRAVATAPGGEYSPQFSRMGRDGGGGLALSAWEPWPCSRQQPGETGREIPRPSLARFTFQRGFIFLPFHYLRAWCRLVVQWIVGSQSNTANN